jgi:hypothetical protein
MMLIYLGNESTREFIEEEIGERKTKTINYFIIGEK